MKSCTVGVLKGQSLNTGSLNDRFDCISLYSVYGTNSSSAYISMGKYHHSLQIKRDFTICYTFPICLLSHYDPRFATNSAIIFKQRGFKLIETVNNMIIILYCCHGRSPQENL